MIMLRYSLILTAVLLLTALTTLLLGDHSRDQNSDNSAHAVFPNSLAAGEDLGSCNPYIHNPAQVAQAVTQAKQLLSRFPTGIPIKDRLLVNILFSQGFSNVNRNSANRLNHLRCALIKLQRGLGSNTTLDIFIWSLNTTSRPLNIPYWLNESSFPRVNVIEIPELVWRKPCGLIPDRQWVVRKNFDLDYYIMGRWRLTFSMDFAKEMGYEYTTQFDDDCVMLNSINYSLIEKLKNGRYDAVMYPDLIGEVKHVVNGLPELTQYWLRYKNFNPVGNLLKHVKGNSLTNLNMDGWDRMYHPGYFIIFRVALWHSNEVQSYLNTILRLGSDVEGRWQEQPIMNMIVMIFVPEERLLLSPDIDLGHERHKKQYFQEWCVKVGIDSIY